MRVPPSAADVDLVTGGAGFIGAHLCRRLARAGRRVRVIDDLSTGRRDAISDLAADIDFIEGDIVDMNLDAALRDVGRVFHLAAQRSVPRSVAEPMRAHESIATATLRLLMAARDAGVRRFVNASSSSVYGDSQALPKKEADSPLPISPYAVSKLAGEGYCRVYWRLHGVQTVSLRYFNVFGPGQDPLSEYSTVIPRFMRLAREHQPLVIYGNGQQSRDFTYVDDVVEATMLAAERPEAAGQVLNVGSNAPQTILALVHAIERLAGYRLDVRLEPPRAGDPLHTHADITGARRTLGWSPQVDFHEGLRRAWEAYSS